MLKLRQKGFTLVELLIVVIILGILASLAIPRLAGRTEQARKQAAQADIEGGIAVALDLYEADNDHYPATLEDLISKPTDEDNWKGPYLKKRLPKDPWGRSYNYRYPSIHNTEGYDLSSAGPDRQSGNPDDIVNWE